MVATVDWKSARKDYEEIGLSPGSLATKYNCSAATVYQRVKAEGWRRPIEDEDPQIDPEFQYDPDEDGQLDITLRAQKNHLGQLMKELNASATKPGQLKQWIKEGTMGNIDSRRKAMYQVLSIPNRFVMMKNASAALKTLVETENMMNVPKGKKAKLEKDAEELEDERFAPRKAPSLRSA